MKATIRITLALTSAAVLAGCGSGQVDRAGFTAGNRNTAQTILNELENTSVPTTLVTLTSTSAYAPTVCSIHLETTKPASFKLFLLWDAPSNPSIPQGTPYSWFAATLRTDTLQDRFHAGQVGRSVPKARVLKLYAGDALTKPAEKCEVLMNGYLRLISNA